MLLCGLAVLGTLVLIVYELVLRSGPSWHAFGFKFFAARDWDPVNENSVPCRSFTEPWFRRCWR
jgi:ABC-type phosphate transport system permease subunit